MNIRFEKPCALLQPFIECYWSWESHKSENEQHNLLRVIPSTNMEVVLYYKMPFSFLDLKGNCHQLPQSHIVFWMNESFLLSLPKGKEIGFVAIRFRPGCFRHFYKGITDELIETFLPMPEVWGTSGMELADRVMDATYFEERIRLIESFLLEQLALNVKNNDMINYAVTALLKHTGNIKIGDIIHSSHVGERQFQRLFRQSIGIPAKQFQRLVRFESTIKQLMRNHNLDPLTTILEHGYYDESHFYKEFQHFIPTTPRDLLLDKRYMSLFYNTPTEG
ncbi:helix-turn-helix domain-containing protein [Paenibacillus alkaliterrae]|uniref:helix-turn-helix domain-containing protein n=1 Tax=Paenibacillus alkaliterrae TaxID=320909 RepID=UPI001F220136|nr:helix-turn-helix domain-containing protein [Paenibacillus alkaliterrae]MCF2941856.1 helix-turn-helix domain-containing protein [Paenibacillus alkaliterrae]